MKKPYVYCAIVGLGVLVGAFWLWRLLRPEETLPPPAVLVETTVGQGPVENRVTAARTLIRHGTSARAETRSALARSREAPVEVRRALLEATMKTRDWRSMPEVFAMMADPDPRVRGRAGAAAREVMGADFGFRAADPPEKRAEIIALMKREYERMKPHYPSRYPDQP